ncbi:MAG: bile acid:sodium symporter [Lentimicrobium sp.]|nr:bile acid:sodium symporter [Lentimicrobium sp.]
MYFQTLLRFIFRVDWFSPALLLVIVLAKFFPWPGLGEGAFSLKSLAGYGISLIFFLYGLRLSLPQIWSSVSNWRLHLVVQATTFVIFPVIAISFRGFFFETEYYLLWLGIFYLSALPSTVSSAVVMVSLAGGNVPGAIFNATFSSIAGILITPMLMGIFLSSGQVSIEVLPVFTKLGYQILLPLFAGIFLHRWLGEYAIKHRNTTRYFDQLVILTVVYTSFCNSFYNELFSGFTVIVIAKLIAGLLMFFTLVNVIILMLVKQFKLPTSDMITSLFCGSTKSLMHGSVMAGVLFSGVAVAGVILLPVLIYHAMQLTITGIMAQSFRRKGGGA